MKLPTCVLTLLPLPVTLINRELGETEPATLMPPVPTRVIDPETLMTKTASLGPESVSEGLLRLMLPFDVYDVHPGSAGHRRVRGDVRIGDVRARAAAFELAASASERAADRFSPVEIVPLPSRGR